MVTTIVKELGNSLKTVSDYEEFKITKFYEYMINEFDNKIQYISFNEYNVIFDLYIKFHNGLSFYISEDKVTGIFNGYFKDKMRMLDISENFDMEEDEDQVTHTLLLKIYNLVKNFIYNKSNNILDISELKNKMLDVI